MFASLVRPVAFGLGTALAIALPAAAQTITNKDLSLEGALAIATESIAVCKQNGFAVSVTVVGRNGEVLVQLRGDGTGPHTMENSLKKAYTARTFRVPSGDMEKRFKDNPALGQAFLTNFTTSRGALPIRIGDDVVGAAGASGAPGGERDEMCIKAGIDSIADKLK